MSEKQPIKPEAKKKHHEILRPATEGHIMTGEIDPELERNQPDNLGNNFDKYSNKIKNIYIQSRILIKVCGDIFE